MSTQDTSRDAGPAKRHASVLPIRPGPLLTFLALALAVVVAATVARWPAHAADLAPEDAAVWNPGQVTYQYDASGCHTIQQASIDTTSPEMATIVSEGLDKNKIKDDFSQDAGVKMTKIDDIRKNDAHIDLTIDGWLSNDACKQSAPAQPASILSGTDATRRTQVLGTVDLTRPDQIILVADSSWYMEAVRVVVAAAVMVAVAAVATVVMTSTVVEEGTVTSVVAAGVLTGCISRAAVDLVLTRLFTGKRSRRSRTGLPSRPRDACRALVWARWWARRAANSPLTCVGI